MAKYNDPIQDAIRSNDADSRPTIERGSYGDRGSLEAGRKDGGVGKPSEDQPSQPYAKVNVVVDHDSALKGHAAEISGFLSQTAKYGGHGVTHPSTGSPIPNAEPDDDYAMTGVKQQDTPDHDND